MAEWSCAPVEWVWRLIGPALYGLNASELPEDLDGGLLAYELNG